MNDFFPSRRWPSSGARFLQKCALVLFMAVVVLFVPLYLAAAGQREVFGVPLSGFVAVLLLAIVEAALLLALWRAFALHRWGCVVLGLIAWLCAGLAMLTVALIPIGAVTGIAFMMILVEEWPKLKPGF